MEFDFSKAIAKVLRPATLSAAGPNDRVLGTGFLVSQDGLIITCEHVVRSGQGKYFNEVEVEFLATNQSLEAQVLPDLVNAQVDVAFLKLVGDVPEECRSLPLGVSEGRTEDEYKSYGFPDIKKWSGGLVSYGTIRGIISDSSGRSLLQLSESVETQPGFSGAPVWDIRAGMVVGMVTGGVRYPRDDRGAVIPVAVRCEEIIGINPSLEALPFSVYGKAFRTVHQKTTEFVRSEQGLLIHGGFIDREESNATIDRVISEGGENTRVILGKAGIGKSAFLAHVVEEMRARGWPVLAFSLNEVGKSVLQLDQLGKEVGLDDSPVALLAEAAGSHACLLAVDQADFASRVSGKYPNLRRALRLLREEAAYHPAMRLLFACRGSDYGNDIELRRAIESPNAPPPIALKELTHETVIAIVAGWGHEHDARSLSKKQLDLLSVPLHLRLLQECSDSGDAHLLDFKTSVDLFDKYWEIKQRSLEEHRGRPVAWWETVKGLAEHMSDSQHLRAPAVVLGKYTEDAEVMVSEHVLVREGENYRFFHENFFDYAYAKVFVHGDKPISGLFGESDQHLFRRSQIRFILSFERAKCPQRYPRDLKSVLHSPRVRHHVKRAVLDLLSVIEDPNDSEWETLRRAIRPTIGPLWVVRGAVRTLCALDKWWQGRTPALRKAAGLLEERFGFLNEQDMWRTIRGSGPWFELLDRLGVLQEWLAASSRSTLQRTIVFLSSVQEQVPDRVAKLMEPFAQRFEQRREELLLLLSRSDVFASRRFFDFFLGVLDTGVLEGAEASGSFIAGFWSLVYPPGVKKPEWACEALGRYLNRGLEVAAEKGFSDPFADNAQTIQEDEIGNSFIMDLPRAAPEPFVKYVLPFMETVIERNLRDGEESPLREDIVWGLRDRTEPTDIPNSLLRGMERALMSMARNSPSEFKSIAGHLGESNSDTLHYLLVRGYTANGEEFCDDAVEYLCRTPRHLEFGYVDSPCWAVRELVQAISPHCSQSAFERLEEHLLNYEALVERGVARRYRRLVLLDGMAQHRLSAKAKDRLALLQGEFQDGPEPPLERCLTAVISPIPQQAIEKMTNHDWLRAMDTYRDDGKRRSLRDPRGGREEVAGDLERVAGADPERFACFLLQFPEGTPFDYYAAVLRGISGADVDVKLMADVCRRCHGLPDHPLGYWLCWLWERSPSLQWPDDVLQMIAWYGTEDPNPSPDSRVMSAGLLNDGRQSVRGLAAVAVGKLIEAAANHASFFSEALQKMVRDPSLAVRSCVAFALLQLYQHEPERAARLFAEMCDSHDILLTALYPQQFVAHALPRHYAELEPFLERCLVSQEDQVSFRAAAYVVWASLSNPAAQHLADRCEKGDVHWRKGAAHAYGHRIPDPLVRSRCEESLIKMFNDRNQEVRKTAATFFREIPESALWELGKVIRIFMESQAFKENHGSLITRLEGAPGAIPDLMVEVCERFLDCVGAKAADIRAKEAREAHVIAKYVLRVYQESEDDTIRRRCLSLLERMHKLGVMDVDKKLKELDRY